MVKNTYLLVLLLVCCIIANGCKNASDNISETKEISINYKLRNKVFEKFAFENNETERFYSINSGNEVFLNSERIKVNIFSFRDLDIKKSKIKSIEEMEYKFIFGKQEESGGKKYLIKYNKSGKSIEDNKFDIAHDIEYEYYPAGIKYEYESDSIINNIYLFNPNNKPLNVIRYDYDDSFNLVTKAKENIYIEKIPEINIYKYSKRRKRGFVRPTPHGMYIFLKGKIFNNTFKNDIIDTDFNFSYRYDKSGKKIEKIEWFKSGSIQKKEMYSYDSLGNIKEVNYFDWNDKNNKVDKIKYITFLQNKFDIIDYDPDGKIYNKTVYKFDDNFNLIEVSESHQSGIIDLKILYNYNYKGMETERLFYKGQHLDRKIISVYNERDQLINKNIFSNDSTIVYKIKYLYNDIGLVSEELILNTKDEQLNKILFKYNEKNNIQELTEYDNLNEPIKLTSFIYEYYD